MKKLMMILAVVFMSANIAAATEPVKDVKGEKPKKGQAVTKKSSSYMAYNYKFKYSTPAVTKKEVVSVQMKSNDIKANNHKLHRASQAPTQNGNLVMREKGKSGSFSHINHNRKFAKSRN